MPGLQSLTKCFNAGEPKAIPWSHTTPLRCAANDFFHQDVRPGDVVCWPTSFGWMLGPWLMFATLLNGATVALLHGSPQGRPFGTFVQAARVTMLGVVPSLVKVRGGRAGLAWMRLTVAALSRRGRCICQHTRYSSLAGVEGQRVHARP